jgi:serine/threonine protein phosphatase PrpC
MFIVGQHQGAREYMEDTFIVDPLLIDDMELYAIFDGHGGTYVSEFLKQHTKDVLHELLVKRTTKPSIEDCLYICVKRLQEMLDKQKAMGVGSTAIIGIRHKNMMYIANVGDCRAIVDNQGVAFRVTHDHKPNVVREFARIQEMGGFVTTYPNDVARVNGMLAISRSLGDLHLTPYVRWEPEVSTFPITQHNKMMVLASDGIWDTLNDQDVIDVIQQTMKNMQAETLQEQLNICARNCIMLAQQRGSGDNITIIIILL